VLALFAGILVLGLMPGPVLAAGVVDQSNEAINLNWHGKEFAQTVTVGQTGKLTGVDLYMYAANGANTTASIRDLYRGSGNPIGPALASATVQVLYTKWYHFEFPTPVSFLAGGRFAIDFTVVDYGYSQEYGSSGAYAGGKALEYGSAWTNLKGDANLDFAFRTYMEAAPNPTAQPVPTPTPAPTAAPTVAPKPTPAPTPKPIPTATATPLATASPAATDPIAAATTTDPAASPTPTDTATPTASASASPSAQPDQQSSGSGDSGGPPIVLIIVGIVALAAVLGGGIGLGFLLARRQRSNSE
jgi:hypothetical protein